MQGPMGPVTQSSLVRGAQASYHVTRMAEAYHRDSYGPWNYRHVYDNFDKYYLGPSLGLLAVPLGPLGRPRF